MKNLLVWAAHDLWVSLTGLLQSHTPVIRQTVLQQQLMEYQTRLQENKVPEWMARQAHYVLCTVLDEFYYQVTARDPFLTPSLLSRYHQDTQGGETFYRYLDEALADPEKNRDLLELFYLCLAVGFKGKYALAENGLEILWNKRQQLAAYVGQTFEVPVLSPSVSLPQKKSFPWGKVFMGVLLVVSFSYAGFYLSTLHESQQLQNLILSDPVFMRNIE